MKTAARGLLLLCALLSIAACKPALTRPVEVPIPVRQYVELPPSLLAETTLPKAPERACTDAKTGEPRHCNQQLRERLDAAEAGLDACNADKSSLREIQASALRRAGRARDSPHD